MIEVEIKVAVNDSLQIEEKLLQLGCGKEDLLKETD